MGLFVADEFVSASGAILPWKIECSQMLPADWETMASIVAKNVQFGFVEGVPTGGIPFATALAPYGTGHADDRLLIVDDVLTTGGSMTRWRGGRYGAIGIVLFARGPCPTWVKAVWTLSDNLSRGIQL